MNIVEHAAKYPIADFFLGFAASAVGLLMLVGGLIMLVCALSVAK